MKMQRVLIKITTNIRDYACWALLLVFFACSSQTAIKHKGAFIEISKKEIEVGAIKKNSTKHIYEVTVTNSGDAPLVIYKVESSCYCAEAKEPTAPILPGKTFKMEIILDVSEMALQSPFIREFYVKSNAVNGKELTICLTGSIIK